MARRGRERLWKQKLNFISLARKVANWWLEGFSALQLIYLLLGCLGFTLFRASCLTLEINEFRCFEGKIKASAKVGRHRESSPGHLWLDPTSALPMNHDSRTTTNPHNPLLWVSGRALAAQARDAHHLSNTLFNNGVARQWVIYHKICMLLEIPATNKSVMVYVPIPH